MNPVEAVVGVIFFMPLVLPVVLMLVAWRSKAAWRALLGGLLGGFVVWLLTMPVMLRGHEYHWIQVVACALAAVGLVVWLTERVSARGLIPAWAVSLGLTWGFIVTAVVPDETGQAAVGALLLFIGTMLGLGAVAAFVAAVSPVAAGRRKGQTRLS